MAEPSEAQLDDFINIVGGNKAFARLFLLGNENNIDRAINAYFDNPDPTRFQNVNQGYDESSWVTDRAGEHSNNNLVPYQFDDPAQAQIGGSAPSRPPSRNSHAGTQPFIGPVYAGEDEAIKRSLQPQETGIIGVGGQEYIPDPAPEQRERLAGYPAFMKPLVLKDFLPSFITILHSIPQCRQQLLRCEDVRSDYGYNPRWWEGEVTETSQVIDLTDEIDFTEGQDVLSEVQRLMAFLDTTDRSYGSVAALANLPAMKKLRDRSWSSEPIFAQFMEAWETISMNSLAQPDALPLFSSRVTGPEGSESWENDKKWYFNVISQVNSKFEGDEPTIYDALDAELWPGQLGDEQRREKWLQLSSPVLVIRVQPPILQNHSRKINFPIRWHPEVYLLSNQQRVKAVRDQMEECLKSKEEVQEKVFALENFSSAQYRKADGLNFLDAAVKSLRKRQIVNGNHSKDIDSMAKIHTEAATRLERTAGRLNDHIQTLKDDLLHIKARYQDIARSLMPSPLEAQGSSNGTYELRGVATSPSTRASITYAKYPAEEYENSEAMEKDGTSSAERWWKMKYDFTGGTPLIRRELVPESEVLEAAGKKGEETLLVYARDDLLSREGLTPLPPQLQAFVAADNEVFREELDAVKPSEIIHGIAPEEVDLTPLEQDGTEMTDSPVRRIDSETPKADIVMGDPTQMDTNDLPEKIQEMEQMQATSSRMSFIATDQEQQGNTSNGDSRMNMDD